MPLRGLETSLVEKQLHRLLSATLCGLLLRDVRRLEDVVLASL